MSLGISRLAEEAALTRNARLGRHLERLLEAFPGVAAGSDRSSKATLLVATEHRGDAVSVTLLGYPAPQGAPELPFLSEATQAFATAGELAYALQLGRTGDALHRRPTSALMLEHEAPHPPPQRLDGASFGGAFFLTEFARLAGLEIPGSVVVLAQVEQAGQLAPVSDFSEKVGMLLRRAPSVRSIYIALHQAVEPDLRSAAERAGVRLIAMRTVADLAAAVFQASIVSSLDHGQRVALPLPPMALHASRVLGDATSDWAHLHPRGLKSARTGSGRQPTGGGRVASEAVAPGVGAAGSRACGPRGCKLHRS